MSATISYGAWPSPLTAARVTAGALRLDHLQLDGDDVYWAEGRASEGGRTVVVKRDASSATTDVTPAPFNVRTRVHEYGGAAYTVDRGIVYFSNFSDQRLYRQRPGEAPEPITAAGCFYADFRVDRARNRLIAVREDHTNAGLPTGLSAVALAEVEASAKVGEPVNTIVTIGGSETVLVSGADFYSDPIVSPDGQSLAWLQWHHPNMPWDGTELCLARFGADGTLGPAKVVAGGPAESIFQPQWSPDGTLYFVSDRSGWWNLYRLDGERVEVVHAMAAEFGKPQWTFGMVTYAFVSGDCVAATYTEGGRWQLALIDTRRREFTPIALPVQPLESIQARGGALYFMAGSATEANAVMRLNLASKTTEVLRSASAERIDPAWIARAEAVTFTAAGREVHAFYYPPTNPEVVAPAGERPPLLVLTHGGPTGATLDVLDAKLQFWTSRGFAVLDVNYSGSTGYGRAYRTRLNGQWGIADVADVVGGATAMVAAGKADPDRLIIRGGSAGGYTTLAALTFHQVFKAGASYYGISDLEVLQQDTHKFESRYNESLIGPYPAARDTYVERSPIHFTDRLSCPIILFQGLDDKVVPPNQSAMMAEAVRKKGLKVKYVTFEGEQHGFRKAENITRALEDELVFYRAVFGM
ncbi:MAG: prolyl oligopeptidase family serine peptidase [Acidobacteriota bacterium]|nr:prolyl oligopeptidase family serine peptidase [Acidobacteriota bacterium]